MNIYRLDASYLYLLELSSSTFIYLEQLQFLLKKIGKITATTKVYVVLP